MKTFVVTGGTGFMGREIISRLLEEHGDDCLIVSFSRSWDRSFEFRKSCPNNVMFMYGDVANKSDVERLFQNVKSFQVEAVFHTAAYKEVSSAQQNTPLLVRTNIIGTENVLEACVRHTAVKKFVFISSDKAVEAVNAYGCTKGIGEALVLSYSPILNVNIARYGNVWGSTGSVGDVWGRMVQTPGATLNVHNPDMTRFWLTKDQAWNLIDYARKSTRSGTIYVPVAKSTTIGDVASIFQELYDVNVKITSPVNGEKNHEKMVIPTEYYNYRTDDIIEIGPYKGKQGLEYTSDTCERMTRDELKTMIMGSIGENNAVNKNGNT